MIVQERQQSEARASEQQENLVKENTERLGVLQVGWVEEVQVHGVCRKRWMYWRASCRRLGRRPGETGRP